MCENWGAMKKTVTLSLSKVIKIKKRLKFNKIKSIDINTSKEVPTHPHPQPRRFAFQGFCYSGQQQPENTKWKIPETIHEF